MKIKHFLWVLLAILGLMGCKEEELPILRVNQEMLPYCWFPVGSYWIYEEENTPGLIDSVYVRTSWISIDPDQTGEGFETEYYGSTMVLRGKVFAQGRVPWSFNDGTEDAFTEMTEGYSDTSGSAEDFVFFWNPRDLSTLPSYPNVLNMSHLDSFEVNSQKFFDAYDAVHLAQSQFTRRAVWVRNVGVVKRELQDGTIWNLIRYHIPS